MTKAYSNFGESLRSLMEEKGLNSVTLAKMINVHRTDVPHFISGKRLPANSEKVRQICDALLLSREETQDLLNAWKRDRIGSDLYERRNYVHRFLSNLNDTIISPVAFEFPRLSSASAYLETSEKTLEKTGEAQLARHLFGTSELIEIMIALLAEEIKNDKPEILLLAQPDTDLPMNLFSAVITRHPECSVRHILCLENSRRSRNGMVNLEYLNYILPSLSSVNYQPVYSYHSISDVFSLMNILPGMLLTGKRLLLFSADCKEGLMISDDGVREFYRGKFFAIFETCIPMAAKVPDPRGILDFYRPYLENLHHQPVFDIAEQPCFLRFLDMDMITRRLHKDLRESPFFPALEEYLKALNDPAIRLTCFFIKDGVERFLQTGRVDEVPEVFYEPFTKQERRQILQRLYSYYKADSCEIRMLRPEYASITKNISMFSTDSLTTIECPLQNRSTKIFAFTEISITDAIFDYLKSLDGEEALCSKEETMEYLKTLLRV